MLDLAETEAVAWEREGAGEVEARLHYLVLHARYLLVACKRWPRACVALAARLTLHVAIE